MKRILYIFTAALSAALLYTAEAGAACHADSAAVARLSEKLEEYLAAIVSEPVKVQEQETDFLIEACSDSILRQEAALKIYDYYLHSGYMGLEAVAIHVFDTWFSDGKIRMKSDGEFLAARMFAEFNRSSLIGMEAPALTLRDSTGHPVEIFQEGHAGSGRYSVLYFYSTDCPKCRIETIVLKNILGNGDYPVDFYAIYTGQDRDAWLSYCREHLDIRNSSIRVYQLWDPDLASDFQMKYGILQTPGMFLVTPSGKIAGRRLDSIGLETLLKNMLAPREAVYGSPESEKFYDNVFRPYGDSITCSDIMSAAGHIRKSTLDKGDTLMFKQMAGDLLYYLSGKRGYAYRCAQKGLISEYVYGTGIWTTADDSLKITGFADITYELLTRAETGTVIPDITADAVRMRYTGGRIATEEGRFRLRKAGGRRNILIFHTEGCPICREEIAAARTLVRKGTTVLLIDMDMLFSSWPDQATQLFDAFDLTSLPYITETDRKGRITGKYLSLTGSHPGIQDPDQKGKQQKD